MVAGIEPAVVGMAERIEFADVDHGTDLGPWRTPSSVSDVTVEASAEGYKFRGPVLETGGSSTSSTSSP
jgi:hypothetical protein